MKSLAQLIDRFINLTGQILSWLTVMMVLLTFAIVILRYFFDWGSIGMQELVLYMHSLVFMAGAAYALQHDEHVRVDIFYREMTVKKKAWVNLLGTVFFLFPVCLLIVWISFEYVQRSWQISETSPESGGLPLVFLFKTFIPLMGVLLILQGLSLVIHCVTTIRSGEST